MDSETPLAVPPNTPPRLRLRDITKRFPGCLANDAVSLDLAPGEIHALLGENGAGKSTLVKILYGVQGADSGTIEWEGQNVDIPSPSAARALGIGMVFQHFSLFETLSVADNVALAMERGTGRDPDLLAEIKKLSIEYGLALDPTRSVHELSVGERQRVEIVRCLMQNPSLIVMDEPTSVLTPSEVEKLFTVLRRLRDEGRTILYISHKLQEIRDLCDRATILRGGKVVASCDPRTETPNSLAALMIGRAFDGPKPGKPVQVGEGVPLLSVQGLSMEADSPFGTSLKNISFTVRSGEIFGIAGVAGNGQNTLLAALSGERTAPRDDWVKFEGRSIGRVGARGRRDMGISFVPEERLGHGSVPDLPLEENALLSGWGRWGLIRHGLISRGKSRQKTEDVIEAFNVVSTGVGAAARSLSGGNLQKFIIGREIMQDPKLLIAAQPTWGVDAGSAAAIQSALIELARAGAGVVVVSQDLDELFTIADRVAVIFDGTLSESRPTQATSAEDVGLLMGGLFEGTP
ncbi:MAG: ABC transporter [Rhodospirillaceae bacterium]|jgi:simple sugar transport system ATP-binding protein|uniref:ABC transporter ATP-binding protein n=1 Tax=Hwanghaeella sp. 1Z406 TaxID=3402811 RepID=UPI000C5E4C97|nr:ABC transporter [Rhodospirillales bacterium]MAX48768.1 ABC transporter [Rhodospirillaceae bacterium]|tara:strand:- start:22116 stop:23672 length:1557 start_codon:yes stop_codon:yes gene_type:complete